MWLLEFLLKYNFSLTFVYVIDTLNSYTLCSLEFNGCSTVLREFISSYLDKSL